MKPIDATELSQVVVRPEDDSVAVRLSIAVRISHDPEPLWPNIKLMVGRVLHPLGIHSWVRWRQYDKSSDWILETGMFVCQFCSAGLR